MTYILVRKLLRDVRPALLVLCLLLCAFAALWVKITQRVTTEITPFITTITTFARLPPELFEKVIFRGPGKVSQAVLGGSDLRFDQATDFLSVGMLHPVVLILTSVWAIGRAAGSVSGELDRGTMELLLSQPVPRNRLILAHLIVDCLCIPTLCLAFFLGTQFGLFLIGPFEEDYTALREFNQTNTMKMKLPVPEEPRPIPVSGREEAPALLNLAALMFALSGMTTAVSAAGRSRWRAIGFGFLIAVVMFVVNVLGQLWPTVGFLRPFTVFFYYQPQKVMLRGEWFANLGDAWPGVVAGLPAAFVLLAVGAAGYLIALRVFTRRDLPAPL